MTNGEGDIEGHIARNAPDVERYTPPQIVISAQRVLGGIDIDPATTELVNKTFIKAKTFHTKHDNGLGFDWIGRVFLNPPGGYGDGARPFWEKLMADYETKKVTSAIYVAYNIEQLMTSQRWGTLPILAFSFCIPAKRLFFYQERNGKLVERNHGEFASAIVYLGKNQKKFRAEFEEHGEVILR